MGPSMATAAARYPQINAPAWRYNPNLCFKPCHTMAAPCLLRTCLLRSPCRLPRAHHRQPAGAAPAASGVTSTHAVSLPSTMRTQAQPRVNGGPEQTRMHIREIDGDSREPAGLQDGGRRQSRARTRSGRLVLERVQRVEGLAANPQQTIEIDGGGRRGLATSNRSQVSTSAAISPPASPRRAVEGRGAAGESPSPQSPKPGRAAVRSRSTVSIASTPNGMNAAASLRSSGGSAVVSVRSASVREVRFQ